jgi:RNA-splicing ligase RtcB
VQRRQKEKEREGLCARRERARARARARERERERDRSIFSQNILLEINYSQEIGDALCVSVCVHPGACA